MKINNNLSTNYSPKARLKKSIKFIIIHYTGMQSEIASIKRLKNIKSNRHEQELPWKSTEFLVCVFLTVTITVRDRLTRARGT